jgi:hypothetical protein
MDANQRKCNVPNKLPDGEEQALMFNLVSIIVSAESLCVF